ncbi:MAG: phosphoglycerate mutase, partial [Lachnospiraceae bacterium]|nr:phosphoglycerate mutase [Lachnospiraceae bacterium]
DVLGQVIGDKLPEDEVLRDMMIRSYDILVNHPINVERKKKGLNPANSLWFWGAGTKPALTSFEGKTHKSGAMISAVDLLKGIAVGAKMKVILVDGANGGLNTNYEGKANAAVNTLVNDGTDFVYVHLEGPDEMGHQGSMERKIKAIENLDSKIIKPIYEGVTNAGEDIRLLIMPDHPTPIKIRTHTDEPIPYMLYDSTKDLSGKEHLTYNEKNAKVSGIFEENGYHLIDKLLEL